MPLNSINTQDVCVMRIESNTPTQNKVLKSPVYNKPIMQRPQNKTKKIVYQSNGAKKVMPLPILPSVYLKHT